MEGGSPMVDEWSGLANLLAEIIEKHISELNLDELPDPCRVKTAKTENDNTQNSVDRGQAA